MHRLVIIGNGFDLAHGLKTSFTSFIINYFQHKFRDLFNCEPKIDSQRGGGENILSSDFISINYPSNLHGKLKEKFSAMIDLDSLEKIRGITAQTPITVINIKSRLLSRLINNQSENWSDIEWQYFRLLNDFVLKPDEIKNLNSDLKDMTTHLQQYISNETKSCSPIKAYRSKFRHIVSQDSKYSTLILNFNYSNTLQIYNGSIQNCAIANIHGTIDDTTSKIVFGYGDETTDEYKRLENLNDYHLLKNIKSFHYRFSPEYNKILRFINQDIPGGNRKEGFKVDILGHSCGISDRVLLKEIFEMENCKEIIIHPHDKYNSLEDNFLQTYINISRHFDHNVTMRHKVQELRVTLRMPQIDDDVV
ncbi:MAG: hypothetical protein ACI9JN_002156 [Bacteroidia bacterium]|jgi:hypothetical protein